MCVAAGALAQEKYPARPVRLIVPFAPGGGADISARTIAQKLTERFGQQVVVDNRPGAGGNVGTELVARRRRPTATRCCWSRAATARTRRSTSSRFDPVNGFEPITLVSQQPFILAMHPALPAKSVKELVALAKAKPG